MTDISGEVGGNDDSGSASPRRCSVDTIRVEATAVIGEVGGDERGTARAVRVSSDHLSGSRH